MAVASKRTCVPLTDPAACLRELAGGKAAALAELIQSGLPVPSGFIVPSGLSMDDRLAERFLADHELQKSVLAVRSSALVEDGREQSYAGQFETVLNVQGGAGLCAAVAAVRASYRSHPAQQATADHSSPMSGPVLIQRQVDAAYAGVCFTSDPSSGLVNLTVVEAVRGMGEALVSGRAAPFYVRFDERTGEVVATQRVDGCTAEGRAFLQLSRQVKQLAARAVAALDVGPLDIEWAWDGDQLWLLQARPITTPTFPLPNRLPITEPDVWFHGNFAETMPGAVPVLAWDVLQEAILRQALPLGAERAAHALGTQIIECIGGRVCWNVSFLAYWGVLNKRALDVMELLDASMIAQVRALYAGGGMPLRREPSAVQRGWVYLSMGCLGARALFDALRAWRQGRKESMAAMASSARTLLACSGSETLRDAPPEAVWRCARAIIRGLWPAIVPHIGTFGTLGMALVFGNLASRWSGRSLAEIAGATLDQEPSWAKRMDSALRALGHALRDAGVAQPVSPADLPVEARRQLTEFMDAFGHRAPAEQDLSQPRLHEQPERVIELALQASAVVEQRPANDLDMQQIETEIRARSWLGPLRVLVLRCLGPKARHWAPVREDAKHVFWMPIWNRLRALILRTGRGLCDRGVLKRADDLFLFTCAEVDGICSGAHSARWVRAEWERRRSRQAQWQRFDFPYVIRSDGVPVTLATEMKNGAMQGTPVSGGDHVGPVRVARSFDEALALQAGEVLIATHLDPGWTALFPRAGALVMEVGGVVSHAAVIARELGIPAVAGLMGATRTFADGEWVRVDGRTGEVSRAHSFERES